jgi:isopenicillin N synthase-like dioxygenase
MNKAPSSRIDAIPGLDLGPYLAGEPGALDALAAQLRHVCENIGFFYIENHGIAPELVERTFQESVRIHALPDERKAEIRIDRHNIGYMGVNQSIQKHTDLGKATRPNYNESYFIKRERTPDDPDVIAGKRFRGLNQWPRELPGFRENVLAYAAALEKLGMAMLPVVARALDLPAHYFDPFFDPPHFSLRMLHYPKRDESVPDQFGTGAHTDANFMTFLMQNGVGGLQVRRTDGTWFDAPVLPGKFLVNSGDMIKRWTNDRFLSTPHRVLNVSGGDRYSLAYFFDSNLDATIACLPTCQDAGNPPKYAPVVYSDYLQGFVDTNYFHSRKQD